MLNETDTNVTLSEANKTPSLLSGPSFCPWLDGYRSRHSALIGRWKTSGFFQDDHLQDINCYWFQFEPVSLVSQFGLVCVFVVIMLTGCFCNFITFYLLASSRHLRTPSNIIIMNLAVSDFVMLAKTPIFLYNSFLQGPALGRQGCQMYGFLSGLTGTTSIMSLAAVAVDRYLVISDPLNVEKKPTRNRAFITTVFIWLYSAVFASLPLFGIGKYVPEGYLTSCSFDYLSDDTKTRIFILSFFLAAWLVPFLIITGCYVAIFWYVRKARLEWIRQQWNQRFEPSLMRHCSAGLQQTKIELVIAKISLALVSLWMISWTPYAFVALVGISGHQNRLTPGLTMVPALLAKLSACLNPIVYTLSHPKIRKEMFRRWYTFMSSRSSATNISPGTEERELNAAARLLPDGCLKRETYFRRRHEQHLINLVQLSEPRLQQEKNKTNETCLSISASVALTAYAFRATSPTYRYSPQPADHSELSTEQVTSNNSELPAQVKENIVPYTIDDAEMSTHSLRPYL